MTEKSTKRVWKRAAALLMALVLCVSYAQTPLQAEAAGEITIYLGVDYAPVYDFEFYVNYNQDLTPVFGNNPQGALNHFVNYGMAEGRRANASFDVYAYRASYGDLPAVFGDDLKAYYLHYINYGLSEGRSGLGNGQTVPAPSAAGTSSQDTEAQTGADESEVSGSTGTDAAGTAETAAADSAGTGTQQASSGDTSASAEASKSASKPKTLTVLNGIDYAPIYDFDYYISHNGDVKAVLGMDQTAVLKHFVDWGMAEGRRGNAEFDVYAYRARYGDLQKVLGEDWKAIYMHYLDWGIKEGRNGSPNAAADTAGKPSSGNASSSNASSRSSQNGSAQENTAGTKPASGSSQKKQHLTVLNGKDYAPVYDFEYYIAHNADVKAALGEDEEAVLKHFVEWGMAEGRRGNEAFDLYSYRNAWQDLRKAFGKDWKAYYNHYLDYGIQENRVCRNVPQIKNPVTVYQGINVSDIYDFNYYVSQYTDVKKNYADDDIKALAHFVNFGLREGRKGKASYNQERFDELYKLLVPDYPKAKAVLDQVGWDLRAAYNWSVSLPYYGHTADMP